MRWKRGADTSNVEDRRGDSSDGSGGGGGGLEDVLGGVLGGGAGGGGLGGLGDVLGGALGGGGSGSGGGFPLGKKGGGMLGIVLMLALAFLGKGACSSNGGSGGGFGGLGDILKSLGGGQSQSPSNNVTEDAPAPDINDEDGQFITFVLNDVQDFWKTTFAKNNQTYSDAKLVLFTNATQSGCGEASSATGPFYCPGDKNVYIDLGFFDQILIQFGGENTDFTQAYVLAHEIGHHVQDELGIEAKVRSEQRDNPDKQNELSVRMELQADCFAGVWAQSAYASGELEEGDLQEALDAAQSVGDDRIQQKTQGRANPEGFTHGTSEQRLTWLKAGFDSGDPEKCDTFSGDY